MATKQINQMDVKIGDVVHFHGARFEIISRKDHIESDRDMHRYNLRHRNYCSAIGKWLDGEIIRGYFGPEKDWNFQGNANVTLTIED